MGGKILIAGGGVPFAGWLAEHLLQAGHTVRITATAQPTTPLPKGVEFVRCGLDHTETYSYLPKLPFEIPFCCLAAPSMLINHRSAQRSRYALGEAVYYGCEQIVLLTNCTAFAGAGAIGEGDDAAWLDEATRGCFNLLCAATAAEVRRVIVVSCLDVFAPYGENLTVDENFRPRPSVAPTQLGPHLTEFLAREFAHTHGGLNVTVVRIGLLSPTDRGPDEQRAVEGLTGNVAQPVTACCCTLVHVS